MVVVVGERSSGGSFIRFIPSDWYSMVLVMQLPKRMQSERLNEAVFRDFSGVHAVDPDRSQ
jgi:hypothetical protein